MSSQVYLMLLRHPFPESEAMLALQLKTMLGSLIRGDSLDVPFMNFIKCHSFSHSISGGGHDYRDRSGKALGASWKSDWGVKDLYSHKTAKNVASAALGAIPNVAAGLPVYLGRSAGWAVGAKHTGPDRHAAAQSLGLYDEASRPGSLVDGKMPTHNTVAFSKNLDSASPQLSFGCSAQERFPIAVFFLRKKTGFKLGGVTHPHTVIAYRNCIVTEWSTNGDTEEVHLNYEKMGMASFLQIADTPVPQGISWRHWDNVNNSGGEAGWSALLIPLTAGIVALGGLAVKASGTKESYMEQ